MITTMLHQNATNPKVTRSLGKAKKRNKYFQRHFHFQWYIAIFQILTNIIPVNIQGSEHWNSGFWRWWYHYSYAVWVVTHSILPACQFYWYKFTKICTKNYINNLIWDVAENPCPNFIDDLAKSSLKLGHGYVIMSYCFAWTSLLIIALASVMNWLIFNTLRTKQNGWHFPDDIFICIFLNENVWISLKISLNVVPKVLIDNIPSLVQIMAWRRPGDKPLPKPMMVRLPFHICVTRPQWLNRKAPGYPFLRTKLPVMAKIFLWKC